MHRHLGMWNCNEKAVIEGSRMVRKKNELDYIDDGKLHLLGM